MTDDGGRSADRRDGPLTQDVGLAFADSLGTDGFAAARPAEPAPGRAPLDLPAVAGTGDIGGGGGAVFADRAEVCAGRGDGNHPPGEPGQHAGLATDADRAAAIPAVTVPGIDVVGAKVLDPAADLHGVSAPPAASSQTNVFADGIVQGLAYGLFVELLKTDDSLSANEKLGFTIIRGVIQSNLNPRGPDVLAAATDTPAIAFAGTPFGLGTSTIEFSIVPGGTTPAGTPTAITGFQSGVVDANGDFVAYFTVDGLIGVTDFDLISILSDQTDAYARFVGLLDGNTNVEGTKFDDRIEVGTGNDIVKAKNGDDIVFKWQPGDLTYKGGKGRDILDFSPDGTATQAAFTQALSLDLETGLGETAYGGALALTDVEVIRTGASDDHIDGSSGADEVHDTFGGADLFRMKGGNDLVSLFSDYAATTVKGGGGFDRLEITTSGFGNYDPAKGYGVQVLDLADNANNKGDFAGLTVASFEDVNVAMTRDFIRLKLIGTDADERLAVENFFAQSERVTIKAGAGNDTVIGGYGADKIEGSKGKDDLSGRDGDDEIKGGKGRDRLDGGAGDDILTGGGSIDVFAFAAGFGHDEITDFDPDKDIIDFSAHAGIASFADLTIKDRAAGARILDGTGDKIDLTGVDAADLDPGDFLF